MKKQTAVEWLQEQYNNKSEEIISFLTEDDFEQAKAMEKEQIATAFREGIFSSNKTRIQYYNETFKNKEK